MARIIEPTSKLDSLRVLHAVGIDLPAYRTPDPASAEVLRSVVAQQLAAACAKHAGLGPASLVLCDVSTLYLETDAGGRVPRARVLQERRLEPQITIRLLTDATGFPLMVNAFEGNTAETTTMLPTIRVFMQAHQLPDVTIVADAGMISAANQEAIEAAGLSFILGARTPDVPYLVTAWRTAIPARTPSPPPTRYPTTCMRFSTASTVAQVRTNVAQLGYTMSTSDRRYGPRTACPLPY